MSKGWRGVNSRAWQKLRLAILDRDGWECKVRMPGTWRNRKGEEQRCRVEADCVHHTLGISVTGMDPQYLVACCTPCNLRIGDPARKPDPPHVAVTEW